MTRSRFIFAFVVPLLGCASPSVQYTILHTNPPAASGAQTAAAPQNPQGWQKFRFAHSSVSITYDATKSPNYSAAAVLIDSPLDTYYTANGSSRTWGVKTDIGFTYKPNTQLLDTANVTMEDNRIKLIDDVGSIAASLLPIVGGLVGGGPPPAPPVAGSAAEFPMNIAMDPYLAPDQPDGSPPEGCSEDATKVRTCTIGAPLASAKADWTVKLIIYPPPPDAIPIAVFESAHTNRNEPSLYYSTCRDAVVTLIPRVPPASNPAPAPAAVAKAGPAAAPAKRVPGHPLAPIAPIAEAPIAPVAPARDANGDLIPVLQTALRLADAQSVEAIALPAKGTVTFRSDCGAQVSSQPSTDSSTADVSAEVVKEAKAAYDAWPTKAKPAAAPAKPAAPKGS